MPGSPIVYLHVGGHKTGTTFLQNVLWLNRAALERDGFLYPGNRRNAHLWANFDLRNADFKGYRSPEVPGAWTRLVEEIRAYDGRAVIDHEMFSLANPQHIARAMEDLSFAEVHLVFTARDLARQLPAAWQEWVKNRSTLPFADFLVRVRQDSAEAKRFRSMHDVPAILGKWSAGLPPERVHLITVPPPGADRGLLWQRFAAVLQLDPDRYSTEVPKTNTSLAAAEATVIRRVNDLVADVDQPRYDRMIKFQLAPQLSRRAGAKIELPEDAFAWAVDESKCAVQALTAADYHVVGDLDELIPSVRPTGVDPDCAPAGEQAAAAIAGIAALVTLPEPASNAELELELRRTRKNLETTERKLADAERRLTEHAELAPRERAKRTLVELANQVGWLGRLHRAYRRLRRR